MHDLHLAYGQTARLASLLEEWDRRAADEAPVSQQRWTNLALWPAARSATVAGSTAIEGNQLTQSQVDEVLAGIGADLRQPDIREVLNYNDALDLANQVALRPDFEWSQELIRRLNAAVMEGLADDERGEYRREAVSVGGIYSPPEAFRLPALMGDLVAWLRDDNDAHPLIRAGLAHLNVVSIHPWLNGNGRTARVAGSLMLMRCGIGSPELLNIESQIRTSRDRYFAVLQESHGRQYEPHEHSATPWLEYFAEVCVDRLAIRNRVGAAVPADVGMLVMELSSVAGASPEWALIALSASVGLLRTSRVADTLELSPGRARAILASMVATGWLEARGERRGRLYAPGPRLLALPLRTPDLMDRLRRGDPEADDRDEDPAG
jgi:Fic/DOC family